MTIEFRTGDDAAMSQDTAREVLVGVAASPEFLQEFPLMSQLCDVNVLEGLIGIAWRHQFAADRYEFKRDVRELQQFVADRARKMMG